MTWAAARREKLFPTIGTVEWQVLEEDQQLGLVMFWVSDFWRMDIWWLMEVAT